MPRSSSRERVAVDRVADRVDPAAVVRLEVARLAAEGLGEVALAPGERGQLARGSRRAAAGRPARRRRCRPARAPRSRSRGRSSARRARALAAPARPASCRRRGRRPIATGSSAARRWISGTSARFEPRYLINAAPRRRPSDGAADAPSRLDSRDRPGPADERAPKYRIQAGVPLRGGLRSRLPSERAAGRARAQARQGDGRAPQRLGVARLRPERVHGLPLPERSRAVRRLRGLSSARSSRTTSPSTHGASATSS